MKNRHSVEAVEELIIFCIGTSYGIFIIRSRLRLRTYNMQLKDKFKRIISLKNPPENVFIVSLLN